MSPLSLALAEFKIDRECFEEILAENKTDENKINEIIKEIIEIKNFLKLLIFFKIIKYSNKNYFNYII